MNSANSLKTLARVMVLRGIKKYVIPLVVSLILLTIIYVYGEGLGYKERLIIPSISFKDYSVSDNGIIELNFNIKGQACFIKAESLIVVVDNNSLIYKNLTTNANSITFKLSPELLAKMCLENEVAHIHGTIELIYLNYTLRLHLNEIHVRYPCRIILDFNASEDKLVVYGPRYWWLKYAPMSVNVTIRSIKYVNGVARTVEFKKLTLLYRGKPLIVRLKPYDKLYVSIRYIVGNRVFLRTKSFANE